MKKILLTLILGLFFISLVSAELTTLGTFQQGTDINLIQICGTCTFNNITTVLYPNSTVAVSNVEMTKDGSHYNYTLDSNFTNDLGTYIVNGVGDLSGTDTAWSYEFTITPTGGDLDIQQSVIIFGLMLILLFSTAAFLFFGVKVETTSVRIFLISLGVLFLMLTFGVSINAINDLMLLGSVFSGIFLGIYRLVLGLISVGFMGILLFLITSVVKTFKKTRGIDDDEFD